jgi:hypothetical protein
MMNLEWDSRMKNNHYVKVLKAVIPFLDVEVGETIDLEGLLGAAAPFAKASEKKMIDMLLQFFQMKRMLEMISVLKTMMPTEEEGTAESMMEMFSMMQNMDFSGKQVSPEKTEVSIHPPNPSEKQEKGNENESDI